jgi:hypothetical protein
MFTNQWSRHLCLMLLLSTLLLGVLPAHADLYWESEQVSKGVQGQPEGPAIMKHYYTDKASRIDLADGKIMIMHFDKKIMVRLDPVAKTYSEMDMDEMGGGKQMAKIPPEQRKMMESMMQSMQVTPTDETRVINGYKCRKYLVSFMMMNGEYWLSKDVKGYEELKSIGAKMAKNFENNPMLKQMNVAAMMDKLDGFPVQTVTQVMGGSVTSTLVKMEKKPLSDDLFKVPAGYTAKPMK